MAIITKEQKLQALIDAGYLNADKANLLSEAVINFNYSALAKKIEEISAVTIYPLGQKLAMDDGEMATATGYDGASVVFTQDVPKAKAYKINLTVLRSRKLTTDA